MGNELSYGEVESDQISLHKNTDILGQLGLWRKKNGHKGGKTNKLKDSDVYYRYVLLSYDRVLCRFGMPACNPILPFSEQQIALNFNHTSDHRKTAFQILSAYLSSDRSSLLVNCWGPMGK